MKEQIEVITYEQDRLNYFTDLMKKAQERYKRLFKKHKDAPYLSEEAQALSDAGRETHFLGDVVGMLEKQMPQKAKISLHGTTDWNTRCRCPACNKDLFDAQKYCAECGQRIDWGK